jgi:hypothetical protein
MEFVGAEAVGWVERSETHHLSDILTRWVSLPLNPSYKVPGVT